MPLFFAVYLNKLLCIPSMAPISRPLVGWTAIISVRAAEISAEGVSIYKHDPKGKVASAYYSLTEEVITSARQRDSHFAPQSKEVSADGQ